MLFNEEFRNAAIVFNENVFGFADYDATFHPFELYKQMNLSVFEYLFENNKDIFKLVNVENSDVFQFDSFKPTKLLNNSLAIGQLNIKKGDEIFPWFSINFTPHKHLFSGYITKNELGLLNNLKNDNYFSYYNLNVEETATGEKTVIYPNGIDANEFFETNFNDIASFIISKNINNLLLWDNSKMENTTAEYVLFNKNSFEKKLSLLFSQFVLLYWIKNNKTNSLIKGVRVKIVDPKEKGIPQKLGSVLIQVDFYDNNNESLLNQENKDKLFWITGFKGANMRMIWNKQAELKQEQNFSEYNSQPFKDKTLPYVIYYSSNDENRE
ncbi:MAG3240 family lipoprotein [Mycoplasmopsis columbinasalis]|uniref:Uncharacterized protein n=1 Tax=Mycoplasmopsis columbinasalis TaxID=114880 RepID=A0A449BA58_9BACT|nr:hypothetical protein [Mycoplasmopsis columbinasalis]VEU78080.1 Uncharacterised protein [Mycoplasmopsis columbinasalis]